MKISLGLIFTVMSTLCAAMASYVAIMNTPSGAPTFFWQAALQALLVLFVGGVWNLYYLSKRGEDSVAPSAPIALPSQVSLEQRANWMRAQLRVGWIVTLSIAALKFRLVMSFAPVAVPSRLPMGVAHVFFIVLVGLVWSFYAWTKFPKAANFTWTGRTKWLLASSTGTLLAIVMSSVGDKRPVTLTTAWPRIAMALCVCLMWIVHWSAKKKERVGA